MAKLPTLYTILAKKSRGYLPFGSIYAKLASKEIATYVEGWLSGLKRHAANVLSPKGLPGFKSLPFRSK